MISPLPIQSCDLLVAFGANLPHAPHSPAETLREAVAALQSEGLILRGLSRLYASPAFPAGSGPDYVNAAAAFAAPTGDDVASVLLTLHRVEDRFGRRRVQRWGQRTLDLDLLAAGDSVLPDARAQDHWRALPAEAQRVETPQSLILPHPRLQDRAFVLVPLAEVAPGWVHPRLGLSVLQMLAALPQEDRDALVPLA